VVTAGQVNHCRKNANEQNLRIWQKKEEYARQTKHHHHTGRRISRGGRYLRLFSVPGTSGRTYAYANTYTDTDGACW
jgi:hypothetical protein